MDTTTKPLPKVRVRSIEHDLEPWRQNKYKYPLAPQIEIFEKPLRRRTIKIYKSKHVKRMVRQKRFELVMCIMILVGLAVSSYSLGYIMGAGIWK